jgi:hypothetical protein
VLELIACIFGYLARDGATGAAVGVLATSWLAIGLIHIAATPGATSETFGLLLVTAAGVLGVSASAMASTSRCLERSLPQQRCGSRRPGSTSSRRSPSGSTPPDW